MIELEKAILKDIVPDSNERKKVGNAVAELIRKTSASIKKLKIHAKPIVVGSVAKDTYLKNPDIDIFILFPKNTKRADMERFGLEIGKMVIPKGVRRYAEHPYTSGFYKGYEIDIVPCYKIDKITERMSAVDRTPFHVKYVIENLKEEQKNEIRLLKQFLKGIKCYGAEAEVEGFSGYLCELLILHYGNFRNLVQDAQNWRKGKKISLVQSGASFDASLVVIDPVDTKRNVASALSAEKFSLFVHACKEYLMKPKLEFFFPKVEKSKSKREIVRIMRARGSDFLCLVFARPDIIPDNLYPQLRRCRNSICELCRENDFEVLNANFYLCGREVVMVFELKSGTLPSVKKHLGPEIWIENSKHFLAKWRKERNDAFTEPYIEDTRWAVDIKRDFTEARTLIKARIGELNLGKNITESIRKGFKIIENRNLAKHEFLQFLTNFLDKKFRWEY